MFFKPHDSVGLWVCLLASSSFFLIFLPCLIFNLLLHQSVQSL